MPDENGYPTEEELEKIRTWPLLEWAGLMRFVKSVWWSADWGWSEAESPERKGEMMYQISTGGWSGNEDLIEALRDNMMFWAVCWYSSRRGGHYEFRCPPPDGGR